MSDTCRDFDALIARRAQLSTDEALKVEAHLASCRSCRELARVLKPVSHAAFAATATPDTKLPLGATHAADTKLDSIANAAVSRDTYHLPETTRYRITGEVGRGGIGRVMQAVDQLLDRPVALKELISTSDGMRGRFMREALITARLQHPSIVPIHDAGQLGDRSPFYAMKLVAGHPLDESIAEAKSLAQRLALLPTVLAIADAIAYAHSQRIIHRDLKPQNILVGKYGETIVIDWGLAKDLAGDDPDALDAGLYRVTSLDKTVAGAVMGTPAYMAPEQAAGQSVDERADVYALGAILYHVVSGTAPHEGNTLEELVQRVTSGDVRRLTEREPEVPRDLAAIVTKAMALEPSARYANAQGLADDLRRFLTGQLVASHSYGTRELLRRWVKRHRGAVTVGLTALLVVAVVATLAIRNILIARADARARLVASYVDRAGLELANGQPARSLAYTLASAEVVGLTPQTRLMAAHALDQLPPVRWWRDSQVMNAIFVPGSHDLVLSLENEIVRWSPDADEVRWRVPKSHPTAVMLVGRDAVAFAGDTSVALIAVADGASIAELKGAAGDHYNGRIGMDHSERWLAAGTADRTDLFDLTTRTLVASIPFADPGTLKVTADGEHIIATATPAAMSVLDRSGKVVATFEADSLHVVTAGDELVYAPPPGQNGIAHLVVGDWSGKARLDLPIGISVIQAIAVDVAAKRIAVGTADGVVQVRSLASGGASWQTSLGDRVGQLVFDGGVLRAASSSTVVGFDVTSGFEVERVSMPGDAVLAASDDHTRVAALAFGAGLAVWAPARGELVAVAPTAAVLSDLAFAPDGTVITASADGEIHALRDGQSARRIASGGAINTFARLDDGTLIAASTDGMIVVRDRDGHELRRFKGGLEAAPSPDGRQIVTWAQDHTVVIWDLATGTSIRALGRMADVHSIRWSPDGRRIAAMATYGHVTVWDVKGNVIRDIPESALPPTNIAFSNDGKWLARSGEPAYMLFALDGGSDRKLLEARQGAAAFVAFSPDDKTVLVAGADFVSTWDVATGAPRLRIATKGWILSSAFLDNGRYIIAGGMDRRVHVWNADSGAELLAFTAPAMPRKIVAERNGARVAVLIPRNAMVWTVPTFPGTLEDLRESARCRLDLEVVDAHLRGHSIDIAACNRVPW